MTASKVELTLTSLLGCCTTSWQDSYATLIGLEDWVFSPSGQGIEESLKRKLRARYSDLESKLEAHFTLALLDGLVESESYPLLQRFKELTREEINACSLPQTSFQITFVGSGSYPISAICYAAITQGEIICLERDANVANASISALKNLQLLDRIEVVTVEGQSFDFESSDVVIVAALCENKKAVTAKAQSTLRSGSRLIVRGGCGPREAFYKPFLKRIAKKHYRMLAEHIAGYGHSLSFRAYEKI